jgi:hypothetical protein
MIYFRNGVGLSVLFKIDVLAKTTTGVTNPADYTAFFVTITNQIA